MCALFFIFLSCVTGRFTVSRKSSISMHFSRGFFQLDPENLQLWIVWPFFLGRGGAIDILHSGPPTGRSTGTQMSGKQN